MAMLPTPVDVQASHATFETQSASTQYHDGLRVWKTTDDLDRYRKVIEATRPEVLVETGTLSGGSARWFSSLGISVITVDINGTPRHDGRCVFLRGDTADHRTAQMVAGLVGGRRCMVSLDSDHHAPHVAAEIRLYGPLVSPGCYLVVEDGLADLLEPSAARRFGARVPELGGPLAAIEQKLVGDPAWERDVEVEALSPLSHFPGGWWVRRG